MTESREVVRLRAKLDIWGGVLRGIVTPVRFSERMFPPSERARKALAVTNAQLDMWILNTAVMAEEQGA